MHFDQISRSIYLKQNTTEKDTNLNVYTYLACVGHLFIVIVLVVFRLHIIQS